uniref:Glycosyltransferase 2-like domain-containing protein n=1 Tax=Arundo donax TaxID=35708 RepID=A0A0A8Y0Y5_ARUDO
MDAGEEVARLWAELPVRVDWAGVAVQCAWVWARVRGLVIVPAVRLLVFLSLAMTVMILLEKLFVCAVCLAVRAFRLKPERRYRWEPIAATAVGDEESGTGGATHPMVLVQIPMYNEREVYKLSIGAACALEWPSDRFVIQVLDDSTDSVVKDLVEMECQRWKNKGINIKYEVRGNRKGYKAGALKEGLKHDNVKDCKYIAMFDADFQPESDFLLRTIPFLVHNPLEICKF